MMRAAVVVVLGSLLITAAGQEGEIQEKKAAGKERVAPAFDAAAAVQECCTILVSLGEGEAAGEWPYEGVYRVRNEIPIGYRVGGTAIACLSLLEAPGYAEHPERGAAVERGVASILDGLEHPLMQRGFAGSYDVRGWGWTYGLLFFLRLDELQRTPAGRREAVAAAVTRLIGDLEATAIEPGGGWNYSRPSGVQGPRNAGSPFMTAPTLHALFQARALGHAVSAKVVDAALEALERARTASGGYAYVARAPMADKGEEALGMMDRKPGSIGRMCVVEYTLARAGRGDQHRLRDAVDSFFAHWDALKARKQKTGTHVQPYGVAPYYFMYAHYYAARAIEELPEAERAGYRERLRAILGAEQEPDGGFNDRVFPRSRNYGTAFGMMALMMERIPPIAAWPE